MDKKATDLNNYSWKFITKTTISIIIGISILFGFLFGINEFLDNKIENKITDNDYVYKLSKTLHPFCIFNRKGIINYNHGVYDVYIDDIKVINQKLQTNKNDKTLGKITIYTKEYLQMAPLLEYIGPNDIIIYKPERIKNNEWLFSFQEIGIIRDTPKKFDELFRLEILR
ncbi:MAG: hypothetical protein GY777_30740 [Candidatus Brocadiaceae bacterium]|nr:hypothetical protein [Candidatus Brocadiaceae bacterium]